MENEQLQIDEVVHKYWSNKQVLITGGTAGLGLGLAKYLSTVGAKVAVIGRSLSRLESLKQDNNNIITVQGDMSKKEDIHRIFGEVVGQFGGTIDVLINNASSLGISPLQNLLDTPCENFSDVLETNLLGPFRLTKLVLPSMILNNSGLIINISSDASTNAYPTWGIYGVSKAALDHVTAIWSKELPDITFLAIDPGDMYTAMKLDADPDVDEYSLYEPDQVAKDMASFIALLNDEHINLSKTRFTASEWREYLH